MKEGITVNTDDVSDFIETLCFLLSFSKSEINNDLPSVWVEKNLVLSSNMSGKPGKFSYRNSPHSREIIDNLAPTSPVREVVIMKSAQSGITDGVILAFLVWMAANDPGNAKLLVGHNTLLQSAGVSLDAMIDGADIRGLIQTQSKRVRKTQTGDTNTMKEFAGGSIALGLTHPDSLRQISLRYLFMDDFDAMSMDTEKDGDFDSIVKMRLNSFATNYKLMKISTPTRKGSSNIERAYLKGDQRKRHIPCPCCHEYIVLEWSINMENDENEKAGIVWELDDTGQLIPESVGYKCQKCGDVFDDSDKMSWLSAGKWIPTAKSTRPDLVSYHFGALTSPPFMFGWLHYVYEWLAILNKPTQAEVEKGKQSFRNVIEGYPYTAKKKSLSASKLQNNIRRYDIGTIPETLSISDGNGHIVLITCAIDINGTTDDCRVDWEVKAYSMGGQSYSIDQGSFGTFIRRDKAPDARTNKKSVRHGVSNSVWLDVQLLLDRKFENDRTKKMMPIFLMGVDSGAFTDYAYTFVDNNPTRSVALKGEGKKDGSGRPISEFVDVITFKKSTEKPNLYIVRTNYVKDIIAGHMDHVWLRSTGETQPFGFMNFPIPRDGKYLKTSFFDQYESEEKTEKKGRYVWEKKTGNSENHFWDVCVYNETVKNIFVARIFEKMNKRNGNWTDYVKEISKGIK